MSTSQNNIIVAPSILAADFGNLEGEIKKVASAGADWLHIDVMDGKFVPPITFGDNMVSLAKRVVSSTPAPLFLDVHLMIEDPDKHISSFKDAGSNRIIVHQETCPHLYRSLTAIKNINISNGVAVNPSTPVESIFHVLEVCDLALVMTVNPGWGGQKFISSMLNKISKLRDEIERQNLKTIIEVDGGINAETGRACVDAGATALVAGSYIFNSKDIKCAVLSLR